MSTTKGPVMIDVPRDRNARVRAEDRAWDGRGGSGEVDELVLSLYARGRSTRDIEGASVRGVGRDGVPGGALEGHRGGD